jgi:SmpA/OmlA family protein
MRRGATILALVMFAGCKAAAPPEVLREYQSRSLMTCCNLHYETEEINDANYYVGALLPLGTPAQVQAMKSNSVTFLADGHKLTLVHSYGTAQESLRQYLDKVLVTEDPKLRLAHYSRSAQQAIREGRVERGMTREQVILSLGYPPTHRTPSTTANEWTYWYNRWVTYKVQFDDHGMVSNVVGRPAPTQDQPIQPDAAPAPAKKATPKAGKKRH